jgi:hypothetical protein
LIFVGKQNTFSRRALKLIHLAFAMNDCFVARKV